MIHKYSFENLSKHDPGTKLGAHFMTLSLNLTKKVMLTHITFCREHSLARNINPLTYCWYVMHIVFQLKL